MLENAHSYKDKIAQGLKPNTGLFTYPVLMAADILIVQGERVPVGQGPEAARRNDARHRGRV